MCSIEIYLNKLSPAPELYRESAKKLQSDLIHDSDSLMGTVMNVPEKTEFRLYFSNEDIVNETADEIKEVFVKCAENRQDISVEVFEDEFLNIIDNEARMTSECKPRTLVHRDGDLHPTVHIWLIKRKDMGIYVLLQKRAHEKQIFPDCYDVSAGGHVAQTDEFGEAAVREIKEELGIDIPREKLEFIGMKRHSYQTENISDNELSAVYLCRENIHEDELVLRPSEVAEVCWAEIDELISVMKYENFPNCISTDELAMIKKAVF